MHVAIAIALVLGGSSWSGERSAYVADPVTDGAVTLGSLGLLALAGGFVKPLLHASPPCRLDPGTAHCDPADLHAIDRSVVGNDSQAWRTTSDIAQQTAVLLPFVGTALDSWASQSQTPVTDWAVDSLVMLEAMTLAGLTTHLLKISVSRPRPTQYEGEASTGSGARASFPSGHATAAASGGAAFAMTFALRHPDSPWRYAVAAGAVALTGLVGYARVGAGQHFYSDVAAGALIGGVFGVVVPHLHRRDVQVAPTVLALPGGEAAKGVVVSWRFP